MTNLLYQDWDEDPPRIFAISMPMPSAPNLHLSGGGTADMSLKSYLSDLERDIKNQNGKYFARVMESKRGSDDEADIYRFVTWQVCTCDDGVYEAIILLYYAPLNEYLTLKKWFGDDWAQKHLDEIAKRQAAINALAEAVN